MFSCGEFCGMCNSVDRYWKYIEESSVYRDRFGWLILMYVGISMLVILMYERILRDDRFLIRI